MGIGGWLEEGGMMEREGKGDGGEGRGGKNVWVGEGKGNVCRFNFQ